MATTNFGVNHPLARKLWSKKLLRDTIAETYFGKFIGEDAQALIQSQTDTKKEAGDSIKIGLRNVLTGQGIQGDGTLEGNEEALSFYNDTVVIDQLRHAVRSAGKMSEQRVPYSVREEARVALTDWLAERMDTGFANQIAGNTAQADTRYTGNQATIAPSTDRWILSTGTAGTDLESSLSASSTMSLTLINRAKVKAITATPILRPIKVAGEDHYVLFLHPFQVYQLKAATATGEWLDIQKAAMQGGRVSDNPIFTGALGVYNNVVLHEWSRIPQGLNATSTRRAVFCGAQAALLGYGQNTATGLSANWTEELFDYDNQLGVAAGLIYGLKKTVFNSTDFGTIVISTYSPDPA